MTTGQKIRLARTKAALSQKDLADKLGVTSSMIGQYENDIRNPKVDTLLRIAEALGVYIYDILSDEQQELFLEGQIDGVSLYPLMYPQSIFQIRIDNALEKLNESGKQKAVERVEELTEIPKYKKEPPQD